MKTLRVVQQEISELIAFGTQGNISDKERKVAEKKCHS